MANLDGNEVWRRIEKHLRRIGVKVNEGPCSAKIEIERLGEGYWGWRLYLYHDDDWVEFAHGKIWNDFYWLILARLMSALRRVEVEMRK